MLYEVITIASGHGTFLLDISEAIAGGHEEAHEDEASSHLRVAYGSLWRTRFGYIHQN